MTIENSSTRPLDGVRIEGLNLIEKAHNIGSGVLSFAHVIVEGFNDLRNPETREIHLPGFILRN